MGLDFRGGPFAVLVYDAWNACHLLRTACILWVIAGGVILNRLATSFLRYPATSMSMINRSRREHRLVNSLQSILNAA